ncbi:MAG: hypothetical protein MJZ86_10730 [Bacteroidales bacterium]|nr:hypothetical protein [Bacteroidales bacterium]
MKCVLILLAVLVVSPQAVRSQSMVSEEIAFPQPDAKQVIYRQIDNNFSVTHIAMSDGYTNRFTVSRGMTNTVYTFDVDFGAMFGHVGDIFEVKDMRVYGNDCYVCGRRHFYNVEPVEDNWGNTEGGGYADMGFVARFDYRDVVAGNGAIDMCLIARVDSLVRMAVYSPTGSTSDVLLAAVGNGSFAYGQGPVLVELAKGNWVSSPTSWFGVLSRPAMGDAYEQFYDIDANDSYLRIVSGTTTNALWGQWCSRFNVYTMKHFGLLSRVVSDMSRVWSNVLKFDSLPAFMDHTYYRRYSSPLRISSIDDETYVVACAASMFETRSDIGGLAMMKLDGGGMLSADLVKMNFDVTMPEMITFGPNRWVAAIATPYAFPLGCVALTKLDGSAPNIYGIWGSALQSLDAVAGTRLRAGGVSELGSAFLLGQETANIWGGDVPMCAELEGMRNVEGAVVAPTVDNADWDILQTTSVVWGRNSFSSTRQTSESMCVQFE